MKLVFNLLGSKGYYCLKAIIDNLLIDSLDITVVIATDKSVKNDYSREIKNLCESEKIKNYSRTEILDYECYDYIFAIGWRWLIKGSLDDKLIIFHDSLLPKYRGFAPLINAALNREREIGVTALFGAKEYDKGAIIAQESIQVVYPISAGKLIELVTPCYVYLMKKVLDDIIAGVGIKGKEQVECEASYSVWLDSEDYFIDWRGSADYIANKVNLLGDPYHSARSLMHGQEVQLHSAEVYRRLLLEHKHEGKVLIVEDGCPVIICGDGLLKITKMSDIDGNSLIPIKFFRVRFK